MRWKRSLDEICARGGPRARGGSRAGLYVRPRAAALCANDAAAPRPRAPARSRSNWAPAAAPTTPVDVTPSAGVAGPALNGISIVALFMRADPIVKAVFAILRAGLAVVVGDHHQQMDRAGALRRRADKFEKSVLVGAVAG